MQFTLMIQIFHHSRLEIIRFKGFGQFITLMQFFNFLQKVLRYSRVIDTKALPTDRISLLSRVTFTNLASGVQMCYTIVSHHEMNLEAGKMSCNSPIGRALMGRKAGEIVEVEVPAGLLKIRIDAVECA